MKGYNDNDNDKKKKSGFNTQAYKYAISMIESSGGKFLDNPKSSAAGRYHFLYELIKKDPDMKGISKRDFMNNTDLQERIMDKALAGNLYGYTYGTDYAKKLKNEFGSSYDVSELTALVHFLGPGNTRKYLRNPDSFVVPGKVNSTAQEYVDNFRKYFDKYKLDNSKEGETIKDITRSDINNYRSQALEQIQAQAQVQKDATNVKQPRIPKQIQPVRQVNLKENLLQNLPSRDEFDFIDNKFKDGGQMTGLSGADQLVTLFENGGSHEQNPIGGIPQGVGANGKTNLVEEGETKWNDYIFSNSFSLDGTYTGSDGVVTNVFENGGDLKTDPKKKKESKKNGTEMGPQPEVKPLQFTKSEEQFNPYSGLTKVSETFEVPDVRNRYTPDNFIATKPNDEVDFNLAVTDESSREFLDRYNDPWTRDTMKTQTGLSDKDIDNMILKGLRADKQIGGNKDKSKAEFKPDKNLIMMSEEYADETGVETHERVHASLFDAAQGENLVKILGNPFQQKSKSLLKGNKMGRDILTYLKKPHEAYGNFAEFREKLSLKPGEQIDEKELKRRVKAKRLGNENFIMAFDDDKVVEALNTIAYQDNKPVSIDEYRLA